MNYLSYKGNRPGLLLTVVFAIFFSGYAWSQVPTIQDCLGAIPVCTGFYDQPLVPLGSGNYPDEINPNQSCPRSCMDGETNTIWYVISVQTSGMLRFVITPVNPNDDYDWAVYNLNDMECSDIYNNAAFMQESCNAAGGAGYHGSTGISSPNGGNSHCNGGGPTNKWNADLPVEGGDTYVLCISNWTASSSAGYTLDFGASTAGIYDDVAATIAFIDNEIGCAGATSLYFGFTENLRCLSVNPSDFLLVGPDGTEHTVTSVNGAGCQAGGEQEKFFTIEFYPPMYENGEYELRLIGNVVDLCSNNSLPHGKTFDVELDPLPTVLAGPEDQMVPIGGTAVFNVETLGDTSFRWQFRPDPTAFWQYLTESAPYSGTNTNTLTINPATFELGQYQFRCVVSGDCPPLTMSPAATLFVGDALAASASASPDEICYGGSSQLEVNAFGGNVQQPYTYGWSAPGGWSSNLQNPVVEPDQTTTYTVVVDDGYNPVTSQVTVVVNPLPVAEAGDDVQINHGTFTQLQGSAGVGMPPFSYQWQPADSLWNPAIQSPVTRKLNNSTLFSLVVTDANGCVSEEDHMMVTVVGGPLAVMPQAVPPVICLGDTVQLIALPSGGNYPHYFYSWKVGDTEISTDETVLLNPSETTTYTLVLNDLFNTIETQITVSVNQLPEVNLIKPEYFVQAGAIQVCVYDTLTLDAENAGAQYLWSNGSTGRTLETMTSGISFDFQEHSVRVTDPVTGCISSDTAGIAFTFTACSYGMDELSPEDFINVYPNPARRDVTVSLDGPADFFDITLTDLSGRVIMRSGISKTMPGVSQTMFDLSDNSPGTYLLRITSKRGTVVTKLVIH
ncbi:T9SS type A sorting domain-containing protein [Lentimicrobium sp.]|uniref:T9SS type A sorting domain-containing protein n=1 Tax=Lentimicrobium sp. TaxID=2034841 RepID=UPI002B6AE613|nr:T9SS type A sorting domain-containing protein [Lentimicrobium sp.]HPR25074.1 T9SS type A sorting domain-containing protein [Lentimicrobium sp.]